MLTPTYAHFIRPIIIIIIELLFFYYFSWIDLNINLVENYVNKILDNFILFIVFNREKEGKKKKI
jgi:hypothetical protein